VAPAEPRSGSLRIYGCTVDGEGATHIIQALVKQPSALEELRIERTGLDASQLHALLLLYQALAGNKSLKSLCLSGDVDVRATLPELRELVATLPALRSLRLNVRPAHWPAHS